LISRELTSKANIGGKFGNALSLQARHVPVITKLCCIAGISKIVNHMVSWNKTNSKISRGLLYD
jgi:hypothetical protein